MNTGPDSTHASPVGTATTSPGMLLRLGAVVLSVGALLIGAVEIGEGSFPWHDTSLKIWELGGLRGFSGSYVDAWVSGLVFPLVALVAFGLSFSPSAKRYAAVADYASLAMGLIASLAIIFTVPWLDERLHDLGNSSNASYDIGDGSLVSFGPGAYALFAATILMVIVVGGSVLRRKA